MASENAVNRRRQGRRSTSEDTNPSPARHRGTAGTPLVPHLAGLLDEYREALDRAPLSPESRRTYLSKVRRFLAWLAAADVDGDPLADAAARDWAVRDYRSHLQAVAKAAPATVNGALAAIDDFYARRGLGRANAERADLTDQAPRALGKRAVLRWLRAVEAHPSRRPPSRTPPVRRTRQRRTSSATPSARTWSGLRTVVPAPTWSWSLS